MCARAVAVKSGHMEHYKENLFGGMELEGQRYWSGHELPLPYRHLPVGSFARTASCPSATLSLAPCIAQRSGVLHGLLRGAVSPRTTPICFCAKSRSRKKWRPAYALVSILKVSGFADVKAFLGHPAREFHGRKAAGPGRAAIRRVLEAAGMPSRSTRRRPFYGPKSISRFATPLAANGSAPPSSSISSFLSASNGVRGTRRLTQAAGHDPPRPVWFDGTFHGGAHRTLRRCIPALAGRRYRRVCSRLAKKPMFGVARCRRACWRPICARTPICRPTSWRQDPARTDGKDPLHW